MKDTTNPLLLVLVILSLLFFCPTQLLAQERVMAKGFSFYEPGRELIAREKALDEAKRAAIEKAMGTTVETRTVVENFEVIKDQILARSSGYLKKMEILEEKKTDLGTYEVTIQAEIEYSALVNDFDRFQKILSWQKNPRVSIIIEKDLEKRYLATAKKAASMLTEKLQAAGLRVFKYSNINEMRMGLLVGLMLELSTSESEYQGMKLKLNEISLSASVYEPVNQEILATASAVKSLPGENKLQILDKGATICVEKIWQKLRKQLIKVWEKELYNEREIILLIKGLESLEKAREVATVFESDVSNLVAADLISFSETVAEYGLRYRGWPEQFLNEIQMSYFKTKYLDSTLENIRGNKIVLKIK